MWPSSSWPRSRCRRSAPPGRPVIDYWGIVFVSLGTAGLTLALSWGGTEYPWGSPTIIAMIVGSVVCLGVFALVERRAAEPVLPLRLFRSSVFTVCVVLAFIVGFAMLGSMTFLPTYLQYVKGVSATSSGLQTLPLVVGLLGTSIASGTIVGKTGRYRIFPIAGTATMSVGLYLLSRLDAHTPYWYMAVSMLVLGIGIGLCMQVLTIVVQSTVAYADLGVATSGVTFLRTLGSSFGAAVFGTVFSNVLADRLPLALAASPGVDPRAVASPQQLHAYPAAKIAPIVDAYAHATHVVFLSVVPVAVLGFVVSWFLKEVPLRGTARAAASDVGEGFGVPEPASSTEQLSVAISRLLRTRGRQTLPVLRRESGSTLGSSDAWCVYQVHLRERMNAPASLEAISARFHIPASVLQPAFDRARLNGYLAGMDEQLTVTAEGDREIAKVITAARQWLVDELADWGARDDELFAKAVANAARSWVDEDEEQPAGARRRGPAPPLGPARVSPLCRYPSRRALRRSAAAASSRTSPSATSARPAGQTEPTVDPVPASAPAPESAAAPVVGTTVVCTGGSSTGVTVTTTAADAVSAPSVTMYLNRSAPL